MADEIDEKSNTKLSKRMEKLNKRYNKTNAKYYQNQNENIHNAQKILNDLQLNFSNMDPKVVQRKLKNMAKELRNETANIRKQQKEKKEEFYQILEKSRIDVLPFNNNDKKIYLLVDGYNIIGCDSYSRSQMRHKKAKARQYWADLLQAFHKKHNNIEEIILLFDGKGNIAQNNHFSIVYSCEQSVDDMLVSQLNFNNKEKNNILFDIIGNNNNNKEIIVITSDRELTYRLYNLNCGISIMKSGTFYKQYIKENNENNEVKKESNQEDNTSDNNEDEDSNKDSDSK